MEWVEKEQSDIRKSDISFGSRGGSPGLQAGGKGFRDFGL